jgi:triosephosphate isomerase (TIM)
MRQKIVAGNWKMHGQRQQILDLVQDLKNNLKGDLGSNTIILPPTIFLPLVGEALKGSNIHLGAQNVYPEDAGAFTGEVSGPMLAEFQCRYVLVGHSERRKLFHEDENFITRKFHHVKDHGMIPILCVGETLFERENNLTEQIIAKQLLAVAEKNKRSFSDCIIAYEPVWAIGTGITATPEQAQAVHEYIRTLIAGVHSGDAEQVSLLYGGSVNANNARALFSMPDIDGGLVGGASLNAEQFVEIVKCIN